MRDTYTHPLGPLAAPAETAATKSSTTLLRGAERAAMLPSLRERLVGAEDEVLMEDDLGQPWVDRPVGEPGGERELVRVSWREVCLNWPDAMCSQESQEPDRA